MDYCRSANLSNTSIGKRHTQIKWDATTTLSVQIGQSKPKGRHQFQEKQNGNRCIAEGDCCKVRNLGGACVSQLENVHRGGGGIHIPQGWGTDESRNRLMHALQLPASISVVPRALRSYFSIDSPCICKNMDKKFDSLALSSCSGSVSGNKRKTETEGRERDGGETETVRKWERG